MAAVDASAHKFRSVAKASPGWLVIVVGLTATQVPVVALFASLSEPWVVLLFVCALAAAAATVARPRLGLYTLTAVLIGQWPWNVSELVGDLVAKSVTAKEQTAVVALRVQR